MPSPIVKFHSYINAAGGITSDIFGAGSAVLGCFDGNGGDAAGLRRRASGDIFRDISTQNNQSAAASVKSGLKANGLSLICGGCGLFVPYIAISRNDGVSWTQILNGVPAAGTLKKVAFNGAVWCVVGDDSANSLVLTSPDALNWTNRGRGGFALNDSILDVIALPSGRFVACSNLGAIGFSDDNGVTWTVNQVGAGALWGLASNGRAIVACGFVTAVHGIVHTSADQGATWALTLDDVLPKRGVAVTPAGRFWVVGDNVIVQGSSNGLAWSNRSAIIPAEGNGPSFFRVRRFGQTLWLCGRTTAPARDYILWTDSVR